MRKDGQVEGKRLKAEGGLKVEGSRLKVEGRRPKPGLFKPSALNLQSKQPDLFLTRHFSQRWQERVGNWPTPEAIANYIRHSVRVQGCEDLTRKNGTPFRMLAIYWHPALDLVIKVDGVRNAAVTVLSMENWRYRHQNMNVGGAAGPENQIEEGRAETGSTEQLRSAMADRIAGIKAMFGAGTMMNSEC